MPVTKVKSRFVDGDLYFYDVSGNEILHFDGTNRKVSMPAAAEFTVGAVNIIDELQALSGLDSTELGYLNGVTAGTVTASKAVVVGTKKDVDFLQFGSAATSAALLHGAGIAGTPETTSSANKNFLGYWVESTATSGDARGMYLRLYLGGAGSGEALRAFCTATAANVATGGTANGAHISFSYSGASASVSGQAHAARLTLGADAQTRTLNGNVAVLNLDSDIASGNTVPATVAFLKVTDTSAVRINTLLRLPNASNGTLLATHTGDAISHSVKCVTDDGTVVYLMATTTATGRG